MHWAEGSPSASSGQVGRRQKAAGSKKGVFWLFIPERLAQTAYWTLP
jgi:hypothetical protein